MFTVTDLCVVHNRCDQLDMEDNDIIDAVLQQTGGSL